MKKAHGLTLVELVFFIVITGILALTALAGIRTVLRSSRIIKDNSAAVLAASRCMDWFIGQRSTSGFGTSCPTSDNTTTPAFCLVPTGYTISTRVSCTILSTYGDAGVANFKTVSVTVDGPSRAALSTIIANY